MASSQRPTSALRHTQIPRLLDRPVAGWPASRPSMTSIANLDCSAARCWRACVLIVGGGFMNQSEIGVLTDATFDSSVRSAALPVLVKFEAPWCGPDQAMKPLIAEVAAGYAGRLTVASLDIEQNAQSAYRLGVRSVPTVMLFRNGSVVAQHVGMPRKSQLVALIEKA